MHNLQKTAEHKFIPAGEQPYDRGGFVQKASNFKGTKELEPIPILIFISKFCNNPYNPLLYLQAIHSL